MTHPRISATAYRVPMDLTEFLLARIAEDEALVRPIRVQTTAMVEGAVVGSDAVTLATSLTDPARVLAECEAKRRIVAEHHTIDPDYHTYFCPSCEFYDPVRINKKGPCPTLRLLALPYADHEDYREEWKP